MLVIGIGNPDRGDDGVGPAIVRWLGPRVPPGVSVLERGGDALALIEDWDGAFCVILVDAVAPVFESGQVHRIDLAEDPLSVAFTSPSTHAFGLAETVELARTLGRLPSFLVLYLVECEQFAATIRQHGPLDHSSRSTLCSWTATSAIRPTIAQ